MEGARNQGAALRGPTVLSPPTPASLRHACELAPARTPLAIQAGKTDWFITECTSVPADLVLTSHMWVTAGREPLKGIEVVGPDGVASTIDFPQDVLLRCAALPRDPPLR